MVNWTVSIKTMYYLAVCIQQGSTHKWSLYIVKSITTKLNGDNTMGCDLAPNKHKYSLLPQVQWSTATQCHEDVPVLWQVTGQPDSGLVGLTTHSTLRHCREDRNRSIYLLQEHVHLPPTVTRPSTPYRNTSIYPLHEQVHLPFNE